MEQELSTDILEDREVSDSDLWKIVRCFFDEYGFVHHQLQSYNKFLERILEIIQEEKTITVSEKDQTYIVEFEEPRFLAPSYKEIDEVIRRVSPKECCDRDITYASQLVVNVVFTTHFGARNVINDVHIGSIPVMVMSSICNLTPIRNDPDKMVELNEDLDDVGGYFVVKGSQKVLMSQERSAYNKVYVFKQHKHQPKYDNYAEVRSCSQKGDHSTTTKAGYFKKTRLISVVIPYIELIGIPLGVLFRALGAKDEKDMVYQIVPDFSDTELVNCLVPSLEQSWECDSQETALHYIGRRGKKFMSGGKKKDDPKKIEEENKIREDAISYAKHLLSTELFPHIGTTEKSFPKKRLYLGYMVYKLLLVVTNRQPLEDRDHYANKRVATSGVLLSTLFHSAFKRLRNDISNCIVRCITNSNPVNITSIIKDGTITTMMTNALSNDAWGGRNKKAQGISQPHEKFNWVSAIAHLRKCITPISAEGGKVEPPRELHNSHWGVVCPYETPEGKKCLTLDSLILTPQGNVPIGELKDGDRVIAVNPQTLETEVTSITDYFTTEREVWEITTKNGSIVCTQDHPFLCYFWKTYRGVCKMWVETGELNTGHSLIFNGSNGFEKSPITSIKSRGIQTVADFTTVSEHHSFVANGFVTHNCGLIKNMAMQSLITVGCDERPILKFLDTMDIIKFKNVATSKGKFLKHVKIFVNGYPTGVTEHPEEVVHNMRRLRRQGGINYETSISYDTIMGEIHISTEPGRMCRPLLIIENGQIRLKKSHIDEIKKGMWDDPPGSIWMKLLTQGYIEILDKSEEESELLVVQPSDLENMSPEERMERTHCELPPALLLGIGASLIPYPDHNQAPRNTYQAAMGKQAVGEPAANYAKFTKGTFHAMTYPQKPLAMSKVAKMLGFDKYPAGQNAVIAVCPWLGHNQEDSIIMNKDSVERGFMNSTTFISFDAKIRKDRGEYFEVPKESECHNFKGNPRKLDPKTGIIRRGALVEKDDILIGKTLRVEDISYSTHSLQKKSCSVIYNHRLPGKVHLVQRGEALYKSKKRASDDGCEYGPPDGDGYDYVRIVIAQTRIPVVGDKFSARHGQKGTIGQLYRSVDLPFNSEGIAPDIIINPLAFPSRMTIGMLIEILTETKVCLGSKLNSIEVKDVFRLDAEDGDPSKGKDAKKKMKPVKYSAFKADDDATPYEKSFSLADIMEEIKSLGYNQFLDTVMTNGQTGEEMQCLIFNGICYYQRLKHMVCDKVHARSRGGRTRMTMQPFEGRRRGGGLRIGHMERDNFLSQGSPYFAKDRLMEQSDKAKFWFCNICGLQAVAIAEKKDGPPRVECQVCQTTKCNLVTMPYATKLVTQEFAAMGVIARVSSVPYTEPPKSVKSGK